MKQFPRPSNQFLKGVWRLCSLIFLGQLRPGKQPEHLLIWYSAAAGVSHRTAEPRVPVLSAPVSHQPQRNPAIVAS